MNKITHRLQYRTVSKGNLTLSPPIPLRRYALPYWSNPPFLIFDIRALRTERQSARMSKIKNGGLDQYGTECFEQQQFWPAAIKRVNILRTRRNIPGRRNVATVCCRQSDRSWPADWTGRATTPDCSTWPQSTRPVSTPSDQATEQNILNPLKCSGVRR